MLYGYQREPSVGASSNTTSLGDTLSVWRNGHRTAKARFGPRSVGYRGELATPATVDRRARTLDQSVGVFTATDPLEGLVGTTVL